MEIGQLSKLLPPVFLRSNNELVKAWEVGQLIRAKVVSDENPINRLLDIGGTRIKPDGPLPFAVGQTLSLRVERAGNHPVLQVVPPQATTQTNQIINQAILSVIAKQSPLTSLLPQFAQSITSLQAITLPQSPELNTTNRLDSSQTRLSESRGDLGLELKKVAENIRQAIPNFTQLHEANNVRQQSLNSGAFFEARLANGANQPNTAAINSAPIITNALLSQIPNKDFKALLFQLVSTIRQATSQDSQLSPQFTARLEQSITDIVNQNRSVPESSKRSETQNRLENLRFELLQPLQQLLKSSESLLSRIQLSQLSSLIQSSENNQVWFMEIPYSHNNQHRALQLRISRDSQNQNNDAEDDVWRLAFSFELGEHGNVLSEIRLKDKTVSLSFSAETDAGLRLLNDNIHLLNDKLRALGFNVHSSQAKPDDIPDLLQPRNLDSLVDIHA